MQTPYPSGTIFPCLEHLELCTCSAGWANLLASILNDAPRIRSLKLKSVRCMELFLVTLNLTNMLPEHIITNTLDNKNAQKYLFFS